MTARTTREALLETALGEAVTMVDRLEGLQRDLPVAADAAAGRIKTATAEAVERIDAAVRAAQASALKERQAGVRDLAALATAAREAASITAGNTGRLIGAVILLGAVSGLLAGMVGGLALAAYLNH